METLDMYLADKNSTIARDLKLNLKRLLEDGALDKTEAALALLALATTVEERSLSDYARAQLAALDLTQEQIQEAAESAAIMGMLNMYYRFRHFIGHGQGAEAEQNYKTAGLRMTSLAKPSLGKERFEMLAFAVSVLNGCESCINAHEKTLRDHGIDVGKIHDLARLAAVVKGLRALSAIG